jgi:hypothetical protein
MSLFRVVKYSSILFFLGKYKDKLFRVVAVLLFAGVTSLLYQDVADYLAREHPGTVIYALIGKIIIVYGALLFVLWQFKPQKEDAPVARAQKPRPEQEQSPPSPPADRLSQLADLDSHDELKSRSAELLKKH